MNNTVMMLRKERFKWGMQENAQQVGDHGLPSGVRVRVRVRAIVVFAITAIRSRCEEVCGVRGCVV
jgi:hypothetical protein